MTVFLRRLMVVLAVSVVVLVAAGVAAAVPGGFVVTPLVSDNGVPGTTPDGNLVNAWGLAAGPATPWWVADNGKGVSTLYTGAGAKLGLTVAVGDNPTGVVFNSTTGFDLKGGDNGPALFLFDSEAGPDQRLEPVAGNNRPGRDQRGSPGRDLQGSGDRADRRRPQAVRNRLPQPCRRCLQRRLAADNAAVPVRSIR